MVHCAHRDTAVCLRGVPHDSVTFSVFTSSAVLMLKVPPTVSRLALPFTPSELSRALLRADSYDDLPCHVVRIAYMSCEL